MSQLLSAAFVWEHLPIREAVSSKASYGRAVLVCGSAQYRGAALLCAEGAARAGAGIVALASVEAVLSAVPSRLPECCLLPCRASDTGGIAAVEAGRILAEANKGNVLAVGPGLGHTEESQRLVSSLISGAKIPVVLDADALNCVAGLPSLPHPQNGAPMVLTPHPGEMARLTGLSIGTIQATRATIAARYAQKRNCVLVLKGSHTIIAAPNGTVYENPTGNPGLARGGSGDALTGILAGLLAQGLSPEAAAACAVWLHGAAADLAAAQLGQYGMLPHDIFLYLGRLFAESGR